MAKLYVLRDKDTGTLLSDNRGVTVFWTEKGAKRARNSHSRGYFNMSLGQRIVRDYDIVMLDTDEGTVVDLPKYKRRTPKQ